MLKRLPVPLLISALALIVLPPVLLALGLTMTSATEVVVYGIACMALNILVGHTGLVSFGHGAWFGLAAYAAALFQRNLMHDSFFGPTIAGVLIVAVLATAFGFLILRRRGVYFSLLTLALSAMLYAVSFRWTEVTGGENGLGGITRPALLGFNLESSTHYYWLVAAIAFLVLILLWRFHNSSVGSVLVAIRENEQRARFLGYPTNFYKLAAFVLSASITGLAGILLLYQNRMTSADPISVSFSGDLLAMVVIGGMRSFLGPAIGALFFILFREFLGIYTENWLFWFGLVFVAFIVFSPTGLVGVGERLIAPWRKKTTEDAAMSARRIEVLPLPEFLRPASHVEGAVLAARHIVKSFGGIRAVQGIDISIADRKLHALIGPNGAGKTTAFNLLSGMFPPDQGEVSLMGRPIAGHAPEQIASAGIGRSFQITNLFPALSVGENIRLAVQARHPRRFDPLTNALSIERHQYRNRRGHSLSRPRRHRKGGSRHVVLWRTAPARHGRGAGNGAARAAAGRTARGPGRRRTRAHRSHHQAHIVRSPGVAGRTRHRPGVSTRRSDHGDERRAGAARWFGRGRTFEREGSGDLYRLRRKRGRGAAARNRRPGQLAAVGEPRRYVLRQEPYSQRCQLHAARKRNHRPAWPQWSG